MLHRARRKRWHLFPPEDTASLYPARIPYEESSVFSQVDVLHPDLARFPAFARAGPHVVTLQPGQVSIHIKAVSQGSRSASFEGRVIRFRKGTSIKAGLDGRTYMGGWGGVDRCIRCHNIYISLINLYGFG